MFIKKFEAPSLEQALTLVKGELGPNALILSTQNKKGSWLNKNSVEVTAAYEKTFESTQSKDSFSEESLLEVFPHRRKTKSLEANSFKAEEITQKKESSRSKDSPSHYPDNPNKHSIRSNYSQLRSSKENSLEKSVNDYLYGIGLSHDTVVNLTRQLIFDYHKNDLAISTFLEKAVARALVSVMTVLDYSVFNVKKKWVVVGPPGSGKTTTLVKLGLYLKSKSQHVSLSSVDRQKLLGKRELTSYAKLIHIPFLDKSSAISTGVELCDTPSFPVTNKLFFTDQRQTYSTGTSRKLEATASKESSIGEARDVNQKKSQVLSEIERASGGRAVLLVIDVCMRLSEILRITEQVMARTSVTAVAFTKLDLVGQTGIIYDVLKETRLPLLGASISASFKTPFKFFENSELARTILNTKN